MPPQKAKKQPQQRSQRRVNKTPPLQPGKSNLFKFSLSALVCLVLFLFFGSLYTRNRIIRILNSQSLASSSVVLSSPTPIVLGTYLKQIQLESRLKNLNYELISGEPQRPGQFSSNNNQLSIFFRESIIAPNQRQDQALIKIVTDEDSKVIKVSDSTRAQEISKIWVEPQIISLLDNDSSRAATPKTLQQFSPLLVKAVLAIEDERFYLHFGVDPWGILRAIYVNLKSGTARQGASTITQQLAKNLFQDSERTLLRKIREAVSAILIETAFSKEQILELYLNEVFLGQEGRVAIHGFGEASRSFFDKDAGDINLAEAATLAGIIKAPSRFSPRRYPERAAKRKLTVLKKMLALQVITQEEFDKTQQTKVIVKESQRTNRIAPYFVDYVRSRIQEIAEDKTFQAGTLRVFTPLDIIYQNCAEDALEKGLQNLEKSRPSLTRRKKPLQAALIALNPSSGQVLAWVGGREYSKNQFDRVHQAKRQPGSAFKPFVYLTALDGKLNSYRIARTTSTLLDEPLSLNIPGSGIWAPKNYDKEYHGEVTLREALARSLNIATVNLALKVGIQNIQNTASLFGFGHDLPQVPSLALGAGEVSSLEMARAYAALANGGLLIDLQSILSIEEVENSSLLYRSSYREQRASSEAAAFVLTSMLQTAIEQGTGQIVRQLGFKRACAGKTGTTNDQRDAWFAGYTPRLLTVVWVGFDDNNQTNLTGATGAAPIWTEFMKCVSPLEPELDFVPPQGVVFRDIDISTGLLAVAECPSHLIRKEVFVEGTQPITPCPAHSSDRSERRDSDYIEDDSSSEERELGGKLPPAKGYEGRRPKPKSLWDQVSDMLTP